MNDGMAQELKGAMNNEVEKMPEGRDAEERAEFIRDSIKTVLVMNALCQVNTAETGEVTYTPRLGAAINESTPSIYYSTAQSEEHAKSIYQSIASVLQEDSLEYEEIPNEVNQGDIVLTLSSLDRKSVV